MSEAMKEEASTRGTLTFTGFRQGSCDVVPQQDAGRGEGRGVWGGEGVAASVAGLFRRYSGTKAVSLATILTGT